MVFSGKVGTHMRIGLPNGSLHGLNIGPCAAEEAQHCNPAVHCKATALLKVSHVSAAMCSHSNWDGKRPLG